MDITTSFKIAASVSGQSSIDNLTNAINKNEQAAKKAGISTGQFNAAMRMLPAQFTDVATQLAGGQNPFVILLQQGGQTKDMFGGFKPMLQGLKEYLTPTRIAFGALASAIVAMAFAYKQGSDEISNFNKSIALSNNYAGITADGYKKLKDQIAGIYGITAGDARDIAGGAVASAAFGPKVIEQATQAMAKIKLLSGETSQEVVKDFASMRNGVASWAEEHNRQYNYLTAAEYRHIKNLEEQGNKEEAIKLNIELLNKAFNERTVQLGYLESAWVKVKEAASEAWDKMLGVGRPKTDGDRITEIQEKLNARIGRAGMMAVTGSERQTLMTELALLQNKSQALAKVAEQKAADDAAEQKRIDLEKQRPAIESASAQLLLQIAQNKSQALIATYELEDAKLQRLRDIKQISEAQYIEQSTVLKRKKLDAEIALSNQEIAIENAKTANSIADQKQKEARIEAIRGKIAEMKNQMTVLGIEAEGQIYKANQALDDPARTKMNSLLSDAAKNNWMADHIDTYGEKITTANRAQVEFLLTTKEFEKVTHAAGASLLKAATDADNAAERLRKAQQAFDYEKQTKAIENNTRMLGQSNLEKQITIALQDLENRGIKQGSDLYDQLAKRRIDALRQASEAQRSFNVGMREALADYLDQLNDKASAAKNAVNTAFKSMEDALVTFVTTGKLGFSDLANSIIKDLVRIGIQQSIIAPLASWGLSMFGIGGTGSSMNTAWIAPGTPSFAGGGYTGSGARSGGVDGKGGFLAVMHPRETVTDHTMGQGSGNNRINITINTDGSSNANGSGNSNLTQLGTVIANQVRQVIANEKRQGGLLAG